jgi:hypothetical protein
VSSASNSLYFLTLLLISIMRIIYTSKGMSKKFGVRIIYRKIWYYVYVYITHLRQQCHNSKCVIFQERQGRYTVHLYFIIHFCHKSQYLSWQRRTALHDHMKVMERCQHLLHHSVSFHSLFCHIIQSDWMTRLGELQYVSVTWC